MRNQVTIVYIILASFFTLSTTTNSLFKHEKRSLFPENWGGESEIYY
jgi:hypothetical protein